MLRLVLLTIIYVTTIVSSSIAFAGPKRLELKGTEIYSEKQIFIRCKLKKKLSGKLASSAIITRIRNYYKSQGYSIVSIYVLKNDGTTLSLFIDEGKLGRIIFRNIGSLQILRAKYVFDLNEKIYNEFDVKKQIKKLEEYYGKGKVRYRLERRRSYKKSLFQLDRELELPVLGPTQLPFFDDFGPRFNLVILIPKKKKQSRGRNGFGYGLGLKYSKGLIPKIKYYKSNVLRKGDQFEAGASTGILWGLDLNFSDYPHITFYQFDTTYFFAPWFTKYITPKTKGKLYISNASREDLGLKKYNYWKANGVFAPGLTLLKKLKVYAGLGLEYITFRDSEYNEDSDFRADIEQDFDFYPYFESELVIDVLPLVLGSPISRNFKIRYNRYFDSEQFNIFTVKGYYDFELRDYDIYSLRFVYFYGWDTLPFHHEHEVSTKTFKGFMGKAYHTSHSIALSQEYRISIYREYMYLGVYVDFIQFKGSGYDLDGVQRGAVMGPVFRYLVMDQFEVFIGYGQDYLFSSKETQGNITFGAKKRW